MTRFEEIMAAQKTASDALKPCRWMVDSETTVELDPDGVLWIEKLGSRAFLEKEIQIALLPILRILHGLNIPPGSGFEKMIAMPAPNPLEGALGDAAPPTGGEKEMGF